MKIHTWLFVAAISCMASIGLARGVDPTSLPIGDGKVSSYAKRGHVWSCQKHFGGGGAHRAGDWINSDGTYDLYAKPTVDGNVEWPHRFNVELQGDKRIVTSNDLPNHPTGTFPVSRRDDAYQYDRNPNRIRAQNFRLTFPKNPKLAASPSCVGMGGIGFLLTGGVFFNALDARGKDAVAHEIQDGCQGHPERGGSYHYHATWEYPTPWAALRARPYRAWSPLRGPAVSLEVVHLNVIGLLVGLWVKSDAARQAPDFRLGAMNFRPSSRSKTVN